MATGLRLPDCRFKDSYKACESYPQSLVYQTSYPAAVKLCRVRLDNASQSLFTTAGGEVHVPFRDFNGQSFEKRNITSDDKLKEWIGDHSTTDLATSKVVGELATKRDPKCRFIFIWAGHSRRPLRITKKMLLRIFSYHQVMTSYLDFISVFGSASESGAARELGFSSFKEQMTLGLGTPSSMTAVPDLGRSGRQFQLCYNLKGVKCLSDEGTSTKFKLWSIRQGAFHHQFDVVEGTTLWIVTKGEVEEDIKARIQDMTGKDGRIEDRSYGDAKECFISSLAVHLLYSSWATEGWRWYIQWLEDVIEAETHLAIEVPHGPNEAPIRYTMDKFQAVQRYEDKINEAVMILDANADILVLLRTFYERLLEHHDFPQLLKDECRENVVTFATQLNEFIYDSKNLVSRARNRAKTTSDRKAMVLQHLQSQNARKIEDLTISMHKLGAMSQKDATAMRIITVVTLIYLPATFVSTFFSTDVISYQDQSSSGNSTDTMGPYMGSFSEVALLRWIQVTIPLTFITLALALFFFKRSDKERKKAEWVPEHYTDDKESLV